MQPELSSHGEGGHEVYRSAGYFGPPVKGKAESHRCG